MLNYFSKESVANSSSYSLAETLVSASTKYLLVVFLLSIETS